MCYDYGVGFYLNDIYELNNREMFMFNWLSIAFEANILKRSLIVTVFVGTILMIINHGDVIIEGNLTATHSFKIILTYLVPFLVSTYSSVESKRNP